MPLSNDQLVELTPPTDTVSEIAFSKCHILIATSSWDVTLKVYDPMTAAVTHTITTNKPLLSCCFSKDVPSQAFAAGADGSLHVFDLQSSGVTSFQAHSEGIKSVRYWNNLLITGSWDKTLKFWDLRSSNLALSINTPGKVYSMDQEGLMVAVAQSGNAITTVDLKDMSTKSHQTKLNWQIRSVRCFQDNETFVLGSIEGKCEYYNVNQLGKRIVFRCHRRDGKVYSVNSVTPISGSILATGGSDGEIVFFDSENRVKAFSHQDGQPNTAAASNGEIYVYATGNDWSHGYDTVYRPVHVKVMRIVSTGIKM